MRKPDYNYRPNPARAVWLTSRFSEELAAQVLPRIAELRLATEPITVYLNSAGGSLRALDTIRGALSCRDADGRLSRIITVALGHASSAAATMLVLGHYAIVHPFSSIHFHGARLSDIETMTVEHGAEYVAQLATLNRQNALNMARRSIGRIVRRYVQLLPEMKGDDSAKVVRVSDFVDAITLRTSQQADEVIARTVERFQRAQQLSAKVVPRAKLKSKYSAMKADIAVVKALLDYELRMNAGDENRRLDDEAFVEIGAKYSLLRDYQLGTHYRSMDTIIRAQGPELLSPAEYAEFEKMSSENRVKIAEWLHSKIGKVLRTLWHFSVLLCRELQSGENRLTAADAYWLGCVDEVMGSSKLLGERADVEVELPSDHG